MPYGTAFAVMRREKTVYTDLRKGDFAGPVWKNVDSYPVFQYNMERNSNSPPWQK